MTKLYHIEPVLQQTYWGSDKIIKWYNLDTELANVGQMYHVIGIPGHLDCRVTETGKPLSELYKEQPELFDCPHKELPIRMATMCCIKDMSYQVHPDDDYAMKHEGCRGKVAGQVAFEESDEVKEILFGNTAKTLNEFKSMVENKQWDQLFQKMKIKEGDFLHTPTGVIHCVEAENKLRMCCGTGSDITYRFYDHDRNEPGRELHLKQVYETVNIPEVPLAPRHVEPEERDGLMVYDYHSAPNEYIFKRLRCSGDGHFKMDEFYFLTCINGKGTVNGEAIGKGETLFVPAHSERLPISGDMELFLISCPD